MRAFCLLAAFLLPLAAFAQPSGEVGLETAFPSLSFASPIELLAAPDDAGRLYVAELGGRLLTFANDPAVAASAVFLDLRSLVQTGGERGLLGVAFHPDYAANGYVYVHYSGRGDGRTVLARYTRSAANPLAADPASATVLLQVAQPFSNHNGGKLAFGPDGYLYLSLGDGGDANDPLNAGQDRTTLLGKLLRLDVNAPAGGRAYGIPPDNPFAGNTSGYREEIYAYGLRNMWKFSFDRADGRLWGADVGQGKWEEVNWIERGGNYGWRVMEGPDCFNPSSGCATAGLTLPVYAYDHSGGACSITGGPVYRGTSLPLAAGTYVFADYCTGAVSGLAVDGGTATARVLAGAGFGVIALGEDAAGELYVLTQTSGPASIRRLVARSVAAGAGAASDVLRLRTDGPQPFGAATRVTADVPRAGAVRATLHDALGRRVAVLFDGEAPAGALPFAIDGTALAPGVYLVRVSTGAAAATLQLVRRR